MSVPRASLLAVSRRTGLSPHVIRAWERRYAAVTPSRFGANRRLYSQEESDRLLLLAQLTRAGHAIGNIARLPTEDLRKMTDTLAPANPGRAPSGLLTEGMEAVARLDAAALEKVLRQGALEMGCQGVLQRLVAPLGQAIGEGWRKGELTAAHEHFATAVMRTFLGYVISPFTHVENAPLVVVGTPAGQLHELGALMAGAVAVHLGWNVVYLGAGLPSVEIAGVALQRNARAVALSVIYPEDDPRLPAELGRLRGALAPATQLIIGGRAAAAYAETLNTIGAVLVADLDQFGRTLDELRKKH